MKSWESIDFEIFKSEFISMIQVIRQDLSFEERSQFYINSNFILNTNTYEIRCRDYAGNDFLLLKCELSPQKISCSDFKGAIVEVTSRAMFREQLLSVVNSEAFKNKLTEFFIFLEHSR